MKRAVPTPHARGVVDPAMCRHPATSEVRATVVNGWDVRPTLDRANANRRPTGSSGRVVCRRLTTAPGSDPVPPAAYLRASSGQAGHPCRGQHRSLWKTTRQWPGPRRPLHRPRPPPRTDRGLAATPHSEPDLTPRTSLRAEQRVCAPSSKGPHSPTSSGSAFPIKNGSEFSIRPRVAETN